MVFCQVFKDTNLSLVLLDLARLTRPYLVVMPVLQSLALLIIMFYFINSLSRYFFSFEMIWREFFFILRFSIYVSSQKSFYASFILNSLNNPSWTVIYLPDRILAQRFSSYAISFKQFAFSACTFQVILFKGMQLYERTKFCFHLAQSIFLSILLTYFLSCFAFQSSFFGSVQKMISSCI